MKLKDISDNLGISLTVVSRVINGKGDEFRISAGTQQKIIEEAQRLGYDLSGIGQAMRKRNSRTLALVLPSVANAYFADMASSVIKEGQKNGYTTILLDCEESENRQKEILENLLARKVVDGIIIAPCGKNACFLEQIDKKFVPVVLIDRYYEDCRLPYVTSNNFKGALDGTNLLIRSGHRKIVCIQGETDSVPNRKRVSGFHKAMDAAGYEARVVGNAFSMENGYTETKLLLQSKERPTAIFGLSNTICLGAIRAIKETSLRIPEDISVMCFDDNFYLDHLTPQITRVGQQTDEMGRLAVKVMMEKINDCGDTLSPQLELSTYLTIKDSVASLTLHEPEGID
ncbi:MAG: LacI family DNA-binding transcriptional regulator [Bacteroidales bacterium]|nr:LacI family DNA-binding transcriptional regulator [Bacteroidales bacterium]